MTRPLLLRIGVVLLALVLGGCGAKVVPPSMLSSLPFRVYLPRHVPPGWHVIGGFMASPDNVVQFEYRRRVGAKEILDFLEVKETPGQPWTWNVKATRTFWAGGTEYFEDVSHKYGTPVADVWLDKDGYGCAVTGIWLSPSLVERIAFSIAEQF